jgi:hypothetical protein
MSDGREEARLRAFVGGKLVYGEELSLSTDCVLKDVSHTGARVRLSSPQALPDELYLIILKDGLSHHARVAWRDYPYMGLQFLDTMDLTGEVPSAIYPLKRLWLDKRKIGAVG